MTRGTAIGYKMPKRVAVEPGSLDETRPAVRVVLACGHSYISAMPAIDETTAATFFASHQKYIGRRERCWQCLGEHGQAS